MPCILQLAVKAVFMEPGSCTQLRAAEPCCGSRLHVAGFYSRTRADGYQDPATRPGPAVTTRMQRVRGSRQSDRASRGHRGQPKGGASRGGQRARARRASPPCVGRVERGRARHLDRHVPLDFWPTCGRLSLHLTPRPCRECADSAQTGVFRRRHLPRLGPPPPMPSRISAPPHRARELTSVSFLAPQIALALVA